MHNKSPEPTASPRLSSSVRHPKITGKRLAKFTSHMTRFAKIAVAHAILSAIFWLWMGSVALGLGFKDRNEWSAWDHVQSLVVPSVGMILSFPGRLFSEAHSGAHLLLVWLRNSMLWAAFLTLLVFIASRRGNVSGGI